MRLLSFLAFFLFLATSAPAAVPPPPAPAPENVWHLDLSNGGRVSIQLRPDVTPAHVERIKTLTRRGFYDGLIFHRVVEGFMAQGGDPQGTGAGGSELPNLPAEINGLPHVRGAVGMARTQDPNSANSQFYIMFVPRLGMDQEYTVFGRVIDGMNFVDSIERGEPPLRPTRIVRASIGSDNVPQLSAAELRAAGERAAAAAAAASAAAASFAVPAIPPSDAPSASSEIAAPSETAPAIEMAAPAPETPPSEAAGLPPADSPPAMPMAPPASQSPTETADVSAGEAPSTTDAPAVGTPEPVAVGPEGAEGPTEAERETEEAEGPTEAERKPESIA